MPKPDITRLIEMKGLISHDLSSIYNILRSGDVTNSQQLTDGIYQLGKKLSAAFDGTGEKLDQVAATGLLAQDIAEIIQTQQALFPSSPNVSENIKPLLNAIFDGADQLYGDWASSRLYDASSPEENNKTNAAMDDFKKGLYCLFALIDHKNENKHSITNPAVQENLFNTLIDRNEWKNVKEQTASIQSFMSPAISQDSNSQLAKLSNLYNDYKNLSISKSEFVNDLNEILKIDKNDKSNFSNDASYIIDRDYDIEYDFDDTTDVESFDSEVTKEHYSSSSPIVMDQFYSEEISNYLQQEIETNRIQRTAIIKALGIDSLNKSFQMIYPENPQTKKLDDLIENYLNSKISTDALKDKFNSLFRENQHTSVNEKISSKNMPARQLHNYANPLSKSKNAIMDKMKDINSKLSNFDETKAMSHKQAEKGATHQAPELTTTGYRR